MVPAAGAGVPGRATAAQAVILGARTVAEVRKQVRQGSLKQEPVKQGSVEQQEMAAPQEH